MAFGGAGTATIVWSAGNACFLVCMKFFWEGGFWQQIFGSSELLENMYGSVFKRPEAPLLEDSDIQPRKAARSSDQALGAANGSFLNAVRDREVLSW